uniref:Uncharacterized protein n=1 Tax=Cacopsylla melanoneura TaxID=428564 RepID=A0A8D8ZL13_9HEMI
MCSVHVSGRHPLPPELRGTRYNFWFSYLSISIPYFMFLGKVSNKVRSILTIASLSRIPKAMSKLLVKNVIRYERYSVYLHEYTMVVAKNEYLIGMYDTKVRST